MRDVEEFVQDLMGAESRREMLVLSEERDAEIHAMYKPVVEALSWFLSHEFCTAHMGHEMRMARIVVEIDKLAELRKALAAIKEVKG